MKLRRTTLLVILPILFYSCSLMKFEIVESVNSEDSQQSEKPLTYDGRGALEIAYAWGQRFEPPRHLLRSLVNLKESLKKWTMLDATIVEHLRLDSAKLHTMPFVYVTTDKAFELTQQEKDNVKQYLLNGGFMVLDNADPGGEQSQTSASLRKMIRDTLGSQGRLEPIPKNNDIYHSYFDFDGPPAGSELNSLNTRDSSFLEGIWINGRLVLVYSNKGYALKWNDTSNSSQLRFGVNMVVFALQQPGGIGKVK